MIKRWQYRIVKKQKKYGVHPVYEDENGDIVRIGDNPDSIFADSMGELEEIFEDIKRALKQPIIDWSTGEEIQELN
jgi:hypothetical protein